MNFVNIVKLSYKIDCIISKLINKLLHHPYFQQLESIWKGIKLLVGEIQTSQSITVKLKILDISSEQLLKDLNLSEDIQDSIFYKKIVKQEFEQPGAEPFTLLTVHYDTNLLNKTSTNIRLLKKLSKIAATAFAPLIFSIEINIFSKDSNFELNKETIDFLHSLHNHNQFWKTLCTKKESFFLYITASQILLRDIYEETEKIESSDDLLWGNSSYLLLAGIISHIYKFRWSYGNILPTPIKQYQTDNSLFNVLNPRHYIPRYHIALISRLGLILPQKHRINNIVKFLALHSIHRSLEKNHSKGISLLDMLTACKFAHCLKIMLRNKIGKWANKQNLEQELNYWILNYCSATSHKISLLQVPLQAAQIKITATNNLLDRFHCLLKIKLHNKRDSIDFMIDIPNRKLS